MGATGTFNPLHSKSCRLLQQTSVEYSGTGPAITSCCRTRACEEAGTGRWYRTDRSLVHKARPHLSRRLPVPSGRVNQHDPARQKPSHSENRKNLVKARHASENEQSRTAASIACHQPRHLSQLARRLSPGPGQAQFRRKTASPAVRRTMDSEDDCIGVTAARGVRRCATVRLRPTASPHPAGRRAACICDRRQPRTARRQAGLRRLGPHVLTWRRLLSITMRDAARRARR